MPNVAYLDEYPWIRCECGYLCNTEILLCQRRMRSIYFQRSQRALLA